MPLDTLKPEERAALLQACEAVLKPHDLFVRILRAGSMPLESPQAKMAEAGLRLARQLKAVLTEADSVPQASGVLTHAPTSAKSADADRALGSTRGPGTAQNLSV